MVAVLAAAFLSIRFYLTRAVQEKYRQSADVWGRGEQYEAGRTAEDHWESSYRLPTENCELIKTRVDALREEVNILEMRIEQLAQEAQDLEDRAAKFEENAQMIEDEARWLEDNGHDDEAASIRANKPDLIAEADKCKDEARRKRAKMQECSDEQERLIDNINALRRAHPACF